MDKTYPAMDPAFKDKWIKALRSGLYPQGNNALNENGKYCCLGVLAEINNEPKKQTDEKTASFTYTFSGYDNYRSTTVVPVAYCGIDRGAQGRLMTMNDDEHKSFVQIADFIEKNL